MSLQGCIIYKFRAGNDSTTNESYMKMLKTTKKSKEQFYQDNFQASLYGTVKRNRRFDSLGSQRRILSSFFHAGASNKDEVDYEHIEKQKLEILQFQVL